MTIDEVRIRLISQVFENLNDKEALEWLDGEIAMLDDFMKRNFNAQWNVGELRYDLYQ